MLRNRRSTTLFGHAVAAALALAACGGDEPSASLGGVDMSDVSMALDNIDEAAALSGVSQECLEITSAMVMAMGSGGATLGDAESLAQVPQAFDSLRDKAPEDLRADIDIVKEGYVEYLAVLEKYDYDYNALIADPNGVAEMSGVMSSDEFVAASERFNNWLDTVCAEN